MALAIAHRQEPLSGLAHSFAQRCCSYHLLLCTMGFSEEVHKHQLSQSITRAKEEVALKAQGQTVPARSPKADLPAFLVATAVAAGFVAYKKNQSRVDKLLQRWQELPVLKQFYELVHGKAPQRGQKAKAASKGSGKKATAQAQTGEWVHPPRTPIVTYTHRSS